MAKGHFGDKYCFFGEWLYATEASRKYGISREIIIHRIKKQHLTPDEAVTRPPKTFIRRLYPFRGRMHTIQFIAEKLNMSPDSLRYYVKKEIPFDEVEKRKMYKAIAPRVKANGCKFPDCFHCTLKDCMSD